MQPDILELFIAEVYKPYCDQKGGPNAITQKEMLGNVRSAHVPQLSALFGSIRKLAANDQEPDEAMRRQAQKYYEIVMANCEYVDNVLRLRQPDFQPAKGLILHRELPAAEVLRQMESVRNSEQTVQVIDTYADHLLPPEDNVGQLDLARWLRNDRWKIQVLVLDPFGKAFDLRAKRLNHTIGDLRHRALQGLDRLLALQQNSSGRLAVRLFDELPAFSGILLGKVAFIGLYFTQGHSQQHTQFEVFEGEETAFRHIQEHFARVWNDIARPLDRQTYDRMKDRYRRISGAPIFMDGSWKVFFNDPRAGIRRNQESVLGVISEGILTVKMENRRRVEATLRLLDPEQQMVVLPCSARFEKLGTDYDFVQINGSDDVALTVSMAIRCKPESDDLLSGTFTMFHHENLTSGGLIVKKNTDPDAQPRVHDPLGNFEINTELLQLLAFNKPANMTAQLLRSDYEMHRNRKDNLHRIKGVYEIYTYARNGHTSEKEIAVNVIEISSYGYVKFKGFRGLEAEGVAVRKGDNIHLTLAYTNDQDRTGYFILHVRDLEVEEKRLYSGVFLGLTLNDRFPVGLRAIFRFRSEKFEEIKPQRIPLYGEAYFNLPLGIRKACTGRVLNMVGFFRKNGNIFSDESLQRECQKSIPVAEAFFHTACRLCDLNQVADALKAIQRAVSHGFDDLAAFEQTIRNTNAGKDLLRHPDYRELRSKLEMGKPLPSV